MLYAQGVRTGPPLAALLLYIVAALQLSSCSIATQYEVSMVADDRSWTAASYPEVARLQLPGINLYLWIGDYQKTGRGFWGPLVPLIPMFGSPVKASPVIPLRLAIESVEPLFFFDPRRVLIKTEDGEVLTPAGLGEPEEMKLWKPLFGGRRDWQGCGKAWAWVGHPSLPPTAISPADRDRLSLGKLSEVITPTCFFIWFEPAPSSGRGFLVSIEGLQRAGTAVVIPPATMRRGTVWKYDVVP